MKVVIELRPEDASGLGAEILGDLGFKPTSERTFVRTVIAEADDDYLDPAHLARPYVEMLADSGIKPRRVNVEVRDIGTVTMAAAEEHVRGAPAKVNELYERIKKKSPGKDKSYYARTAWDVYCQHVNPDYEGCTKYGKKRGKPYSAPIAAALSALSAAGGGFPWHKGQDAEEFAGRSYHAALAVKSAMDAMEEIPEYLMPVYQQAMKAMDAAGQAGREAHQLRMMMRRTAQRYQ